MAGEVTVYVTLRYNNLETEPYFVDELGTTQNKFVQDSFVLEATTQAPSAPTLELARLRLPAGATEIRDAADPNNPGLNEIDFRQVKYTGKEVLELRDLSDVDPAEVDAFNGMENPSAANPIATVSRADSIVAPVRNEVVIARGTTPSLDDRLDVMLTDDGSFKGITKVAPSAPLTGGGTAGDVPVGISNATPTLRGAMSGADKAKLDGIESGATADQTAVEILSAVKTVDGPGSGLDADTVDGKHANELSADPATINHNLLAGLVGASPYYHLSSKQNNILSNGFWKLFQQGDDSTIQFAGSFRLYFILNTTFFFGTRTARIHLERDGGENGTLFSGGTLLADWDFDYIPNPAWIRDFYVSFSGIFQIGTPTWWAFRINWLQLVPSDEVTTFNLTGINGDFTKQLTARHWDLLVNYTFRGPTGFTFWGSGPAFASGNIYFTYYKVPPT